MKRKRRTEIIENEVLTKFRDTKHFLVNKYYNLFMNKLEVEGADYQQRDYMLRQFWSVGTIATFLLEGSKGATDAPEGLLVYCGYTAIDYNTYDWPIHVNLINKRGVPFIPSTPQTVDKDVVLGFILRNHKPIKFIVEYFARKIALVESVIQTQLLAKKMPFILKTTPENKQKVENLFTDILDDNVVLYLDADTVNDIDVLQTSSGYDIDKLKSLENDYENELRETLGLDNLGVHEKKEHLITSEIESNNEITEDSGSSILDTLEEFSEQVKEVFGYDLKFIWKDSPKQEAEKDSFDSEEEEKEEEKE